MKQSNNYPLFLADFQSSDANYQAFNFFILLTPLFALIGNAASDIWLTLASVGFVILYSYKQNWRNLPYSWLMLALVFWGWIVICAAISPWPINSLQEALSWLRFPIFAATLAFTLGQKDPRMRERLLVTMIIGVVIMAGVLFFQRLSNPSVIRLYGLWNSPKPGWYMFGVGIPVIVFSLQRIYESHKILSWQLLLIFGIVTATFATGEVYVSLAMVLAIAVFVVLAGITLKKLVIFTAAVTMSLTLVFSITHELFIRFSSEALTRLPWRKSSDYYDPWVGGLNTGLKNWFFGVGPDNFDLYCQQFKDSGELVKLGIKTCTFHPHQLYIQIFAETGIIGFGLFLLFVMVVLVGAWSIRRKWRVSYPDNYIMTSALTIIVVALWPISTYSEAFGQHKNFFTWFLLGWGFAICNYCSRTLNQDNIDRNVK